MDSIERISSVQFGFYSEEEAKALAHVQVAKPLAFNADKSPIEDGIYDPRLGVWPTDDRGSCVTCGQNSESCLGHPGVLPLTGPVLNPVLFPLTYKLMKAKCWSCHKLRVPFDKTKLLGLQFQLLAAGKLFDALSASSLVSAKNLSTETEALAQVVEDKQNFEHLARLAGSAPSGVRNENAFLNVHRELTKEFWGSVVPRVCPYCKSPQPKVTKEGFVKIIRHPISER